MTRHKAYTKIPFAALFFAATLISPALHALNIPDYRFHTMPETSYYGGIHSIAKDSVGRMWFSGYDALFMYNGTSFVRMTDLVTNPLPNSYWSYGQVITDNRKGLYVGTNQGLLRFNYRKLEFEFVLEGNIGSAMSVRTYTDPLHSTTSRITQLPPPTDAKRTYCPVSRFRR